MYNFEIYILCSFYLLIQIFGVFAGRECGVPIEIPTLALSYTAISYQSQATYQCSNGQWIEKLLTSSITVVCEVGKFKLLLMLNRNNPNLVCFNFFYNREATTLMKTVLFTYICK